MLQLLSAFSHTANVIVEKIVVMGVVFIAILISAGIVTRDVLGYPIIWLTETTMLAFSWTLFLGVSVAFKRDENICVEIILRRLNRLFPRWPRLLIIGCCLIFLGVAVKEGIEIVESTSGTDYNTIDVSTGWFYASFPVSAALAMVHLLEKALRVFVGPTPTDSDGEKA